MDARKHIVQHIKRYWLLAVIGAFVASVAIVGAPAWAAPSPRALYQTVPDPTPTSPSNPVATATPRPDDDDDDDGDTGGGGGDGGGGGGEVIIDDSLPAELLGEDEEPAAGTSTGGSSVSELTARVAVSQLNVRVEPTTGTTVLGRITNNYEVTVEARNADGTWWYICCLPDTETHGWVSAQFMTPSFDRAQANDLLDVFGEEPVETAEPTPVGTPSAPERQVSQAAAPLGLDFKLDPPFLWQGITGTLTITVTNPNELDVARAELSDELPSTLTFLSAEADADGTFETSITENGNTLVIFRWPEILSETSVTAQIDFEVNETLDNGDVFDNLVGVRARNATYSSGAITIGMPPVLPPLFD